MMTIIRNADYAMEWDRGTGEVVTTYRDFKFSHVKLNDDHIQHARKLKVISPGEFNLLHEAAHHLVGKHLPGAIWGGCPIIFRSAHGQEQIQPEAKVAEFLYTSMQYLALNEREPYHGWEGIVMLRWLRVPIHEIRQDLRRILEQVRVDGA